MRTISFIANTILDHTRGMKEITEILKELDPQFSQIVQDFQTASEKLKSLTGTSSAEYLFIKEQSMYYELLSLCWSGFLLNYLCFANPANALILNEDFDFLLQEHRLNALPSSKKAAQFEEKLLPMIPSDQWDILEPVTEYFSYLQTVGYKLAHYYGYHLADHLLQYFLPGYVADTVVFSKYQQKIKDYLEIKVEELN